ncbi:hypothetical protein [Streptomyces sp. TRM75561]|uniref:hypothetical protein n=1 Tax=Streptomyces sp. TRM75561 TaxID=2975269 RepID=UPI00244852AA|nr:hypothetical protein [Streptomyces sp. TRM75561]MDH3037874.1 hypothetical protein [Streptomyces sp. TRM75561]
MTRRDDDRQPPHHRNLTCYTNYGCRLPECVDRYRDYNRNYARAMRNGQHRSLVDANPVRQHLQLLQQHGISLRRAAALAGVGACSLHPLFRRPVRHTVRPEIATAVLAIDPQQVTPSHIDATGTARRIQALVADGWPMAHLADHFGVYRSYVHALIQRSDNGQPILASTAGKVADAYEQLAEKRPARNGVNPRLVKRARGLAASRRWPPTSYWADRMDVIGDPHFQPEHGLTKREVIAREAHWLMQHGGLDRAAAAARLGVHKSYIDHAIREHPATELAA